MKYTCKSVLVPTSGLEEDFAGVVYLYIAPDAKTGFAGWQCALEYPWDLD